jgi:phosphoribosylanthranilate isomerase
MTLVKMCGLRTMEDIDHVNEAGPDMAGMIMVPGFRRTVSKEEAKSMVSRLSNGIWSVGVFMDQDREDVIRIADYVGFDMIQLHGSEDEAYIEDIKAGSDVPVIKRFGLSTEQIESAERSYADFVLMDPGAGSGQEADLSVIKNIRRRIIIAGGLTADNVADAIRAVRPYGVDTSSGIETDGSKDREKMMRFISAVRAEDARKEEQL